MSNLRSSESTKSSVDLNGCTGFSVVGQSLGRLPFKLKSSWQIIVQIHSKVLLQLDCEIFLCFHLLLSWNLFYFINCFEKKLVFLEFMCHHVGYIYRQIKSIFKKNNTPRRHETGYGLLQS